jgi:hypothetical protein
MPTLPFPSFPLKGAKLFDVRYIHEISGLFLERDTTGNLRYSYGASHEEIAAHRGRICPTAKSGFPGLQVPT